MPQTGIKRSKSSDMSPSTYTQGRTDAAEAQKGTKRKHSEAGPRRAVKKSAATSSRVIATPGTDRLSCLSPEILDIIANSIVDKPTISIMSRTSKHFYSLMTPRLYNHLVVSAMFHAHIPKVIRTLEPHLTIKQKKQLKKEGKYKGQQERYSTGLNENQVPFCASHVRHLVIGASDPGKKHKYIVERYYEEALKNMANIEVLETRVVNAAIAQKIASLANLKAMSILETGASSEDLMPLSNVGGLKHLHLELGYDRITSVGQQLIRNSMTTLKSLAMISNSGYYHFFQDWSKTPSSDHQSIFSSLRSLHISGTLIDQEYIDVFRQVIDFARLHKLEFGYVRDDDTRLWRFLADLATSYRTLKTDLYLRDLSIDMYDNYFPRSVSAEMAQFVGKCAFIASFDTLTTLNLLSYGQYDPKDNPINPGLSQDLLHAILQHKNLRTLRISYNGKISGLDIPYLSAKTVGDIVDGLPSLREFEFAPDELQIDHISRALCRGKYLESIRCFPFASWGTFAPSEVDGQSIITSILSAFMLKADIGDNEEFVWEDYSRLKQLATSNVKYDIASKFEKPKRGQAKPMKVEVHVGDKPREVWYRAVPSVNYIHIGYDPTFDWVSKVEKDLD